MYCFDSLGVKRKIWSLIHKILIHHLQHRTRYWVILSICLGDVTFRVYYTPSSIIRKEYCYVRGCPYNKILIIVINRDQIEFVPVDYISKFNPNYNAVFWKRQEACTPFVINRPNQIWFLSNGHGNKSTTIVVNTKDQVI